MSDPMGEDQPAGLYLMVDLPNGRECLASSFNYNSYRLLSLEYRETVGRLSGNHGTGLW
jgi:hypothetical protein